MKIERKLHKHTNRTYYSECSPEDLFTDVSFEKTKGKVFVGGTTKDGKWMAQYGRPTEMAERIAKEYPLGATLASFKVIKWDNGQVLTILNTCTDGFYFDCWAGLTPLPVK